MADSEDKIKSDLEAHIAKGGGGCSAWYVGIAKDPRDRLFNGHGVQQKGDWWIYRQAQSSDAARSVESHFVGSLGTDGGTGGGDPDSRFVYAYKKNAHTRP
jgi:hypothetical protein